MHTLSKPLRDIQQDQTIESVICEDPNHAHANPEISILRQTVNGHAVIVETELNSFRYSIWIDGIERGAFITSPELNQVIQELQQS